jgi:hypothetical protein
LGFLGTFNPWRGIRAHGQVQAPGQVYYSAEV